jgi:hypothetical protein
MAANRIQLRILGLMAAVLLAVFVAILILRNDPPANDRPAPPPTSPAPRPNTQLPLVVDIRQANLPKLSERPVRHALALVQPNSDDGSATPVLIIGDDGQLRILDNVTLAPPADPDGNAHQVLSPTALSPDGRHAAFPQRDQMIVVDLTTARPTTIPLAGYNEFVRWQDSRLIVERGATAVLVDPTSPAPQPIDHPTGNDLVSTAAPATSLLPGRIRVWPATDTALTGQAATAKWTGPGWANSGRIARAAYLPERDMGAVLVVDQQTGATVHTHDLCRSAGPTDQCASAAGWLDPDTVLITMHSDPTRLLAWHLNLNTLTQLTEFPGGTVTIALAQS